MTQAAIRSNTNMLWLFSIAGSLLLQLLLANLLWQVCTSYDHRAQPQIQVININRPPPATPTKAPEVTSELPVMPETFTPKPLAPEPELPGKEPEMAKEPVKAEPVKPAPEILKQEVLKARVIKEPKTKVKPDLTPPKKPARVLEKTPAKPQTPSATHFPESIPAARVATAGSKSADTARPLIKANTEPGESSAAIPVLSAKDFSSYLQKIYRIIEKNKRYPNEARRRGLKGKVLVSFSINAEGKATDATAQNTVAPELQQAALKLLASQKFPHPPPDWNTQARISMTINYSLR